MAKQTYDYVRNHYGVPAYVGVPVVSNWSDKKQKGVVTESHGDAYVWVWFEGEKFSLPVHPHDLLYQPEGATQTMRD